MTNSNPIGIFDSGVGGLTVFKEIARQLPHENLIYVGDTSRVPYGTRSKKEIVEFSSEIVHFLLKQNVKALVVACNTISSNALEEIKKSTDIPVIEVITPTIDEAIKISQTKKIGVMGTDATINSGVYQKLIEDHGATVKTIPCPLLVPLIEKGMINSLETEQALSNYLNPLINGDIDTIILGCTHYPLVKTLVISLIPENISLLDSASPTAKRLEFELHKLSLLNLSARSGEHTILTTDDPKKSERIISLLFSSSIKINNITL